MQNGAKCTSRSESGEKKWIFIKKKATYVLGPKPNKKKKDKKKEIKIDVRQVKMCARDQASEGEAGGEEGEWASSGMSGSPEYSAERDSSASSSLGMSKLKSRPG